MSFIQKQKVMGFNFVASEGSSQHAGRNGSERGGSREAEEEDPGAGGDAEAFGGGVAAGNQSQAGRRGLPFSSSRVMLSAICANT